MPVMDGFEATRQIRLDTRFANLPILAMTANAMAGDKEKCIQSGMNDHIAKPIDVAHLFLTLAKWIKPKPGRMAAQLSSSQAVTSVLEKTNTEAPVEPVHTAHEDIQITKKEVRADGLPNIEGLDLDGALARMGGSKKLLLKLLNRFTETQCSVMTRIKTAIENNDNNSAVREAHTVKGLAGNIGDKLLAKRAGVVEAMLKQGENEGLVGALDEMASELEGLIARISKGVGLPVGAKTQVQLSTVNMDEATKELFLTELLELDSLLVDSDTSAAELAEKLIEKLSQYGVDEHAKKMSQSIDAFDFDTAQTHLRTISSALGLAL